MFYPIQKDIPSCLYFIFQSRFKIGDTVLPLKKVRSEYVKSHWKGSKIYCFSRPNYGDWHFWRLWVIFQKFLAPPPDCFFIYKELEKCQYKYCPNSPNLINFCRCISLHLLMFPISVLKRDLWSYEKWQTFEGNILQVYLLAPTDGPHFSTKKGSVIILKMTNFWRKNLAIFHKVKKIEICCIYNTFASYKECVLQDNI